MGRKSRNIVALLCAFCWGALGSQVSGRITLEKKASRKTVAPAIYNLRGVAVLDGGSVATASTPYDQIAVWLESTEASPPPPVAAIMQQHERQFEPDLLIIPVGSTVDFPNSDPIFHNIFSLSRTQSFDLGYYSKGRSRRVSFSRAGIVQVYCHVHPNMYGVIVVTSSRWSGKPAQNGAFSWSDVPPGKYRLLVWQKSVGVLHRSITVPKTGSASLNIAVPEPDPEN